MPQPVARQLLAPCTALCLGALLGSPFAGYAAEPVLAIVETGVDRAAPGIIAKLDGSGPFRVVALSGFIPLLQQRDAKSGIPQRAAELREQGHQALLSLDHESAVAKLNQALSVLRSGYVRLYDPRVLAEVHVLLGVVAVRSARPVVAREQFVAAHHLDNTLELDAHYSPQVRQAYDEALETLPSRPALDAQYVARALELLPEAALALAITVDAQDDGRALLRGLLFDRKKSAYVAAESESLSMVDEGAKRVGVEAFATRLRRLLNQTLNPATGVAPVVATDPFVPVPPAHSTAAKHRPWYKRWYVWAAVGLVAGSVAVALPLALQRDVVDLSVTLQPEGS